MRIADEEATLSELIQHSSDTIARLNSSRRRTLRLTRRDAEDLVLTTLSRAEQDAEVIDGATRLIAAIVSDPVIKSQIGMRAIVQAYPWTRFLPHEDLEAFLRELSETLPAAVDLDNLAPIHQLLREWKATAEVHADPELAAILRSDSGGDFGQVLDPTHADAPDRRRRRSAR